MTQHTAVVTLLNRNGMHARPAHMFVQTANRFASDLQVCRSGQEPVNGKSIFGIMCLAAENGTELELSASGEDAAEMLAALTALVESKFDGDDD